MKYLETNSLRQVSAQLADNNFIQDKYTSILSLIEIISGISNEESFLLRQSILKKILQSNLKINFDLPNTILYQAFGFSNGLYPTLKIEDFVQILRIITTIKNFKSLDEVISINSLNETWIVIKQYDEIVNRIGWKNSIQKRFDENKDIKKAIEDHRNRWHSNNIEYLKKLTINYFARILLECYPDETNYHLEYIISSYDNSIDIYLLSTAYYVDKLVSTKNLPGKNDYFDLQHLIYLYGNMNEIVSDDKLLHKIVKINFPNNIIHTKDLFN